MASNKASSRSTARVVATQAGSSGSSSTTGATMEHIIKRGSTYHFRRRIPADLIDAHNGKREITYSLQTKDRAQAAEAARRASVRLDEEWARMRRARPKDAEPIPSDWDLLEVASKIMVVPSPR